MPFDEIKYSVAPQASSPETGASADSVPYAVLLEEFNAGRSVEEIAAAHALRPRQVRTRLGKAARKTGTPYDRARAALRTPGEAARVAGAGTPAASPAASDFTPDAVLGICESLNSLAVYLYTLKSKPPKRFPVEKYAYFHDVDKAAVKAFAPHVIAEMPTWFKQEEKAGLWAFGLVLGGAILKNIIRLDGALKEEKSESDVSMLARGIRAAPPVSHRDIGIPTQDSVDHSARRQSFRDAGNGGLREASSDSSFAPSAAGLSNSQFRALKIVSPWVLHPPRQRAKWVA
jgi:hypothetical protein